MRPWTFINAEVRPGTYSIPRFVDCSDSDLLCRVYLLQVYSCHLEGCPAESIVAPSPYVRHERFEKAEHARVQISDTNSPVHPETERITVLILKLLNDRSFGDSYPDDRKQGNAAIIWAWQTFSISLPMVCSAHFNSQPSNVHALSVRHDHHIHSRMRPGDSAKCCLFKMTSPAPTVSCSRRRNSGVSAGQCTQGGPNEVI